MDGGFFLAMAPGGTVVPQDPSRGLEINTAGQDRHRL
jgi:hypothetical protein